MSVQIGQSDPQLLDALRAGDSAAYGALYERHRPAARALARHLLRLGSIDDADDIVAETFTRILDLIRRGGGPRGEFRPYLLAAVRRAVYDRADRRDVPTHEIERYAPGEPFVDPALARCERADVARAFQSLPERWRVVLWHTAVEDAQAAEIAPLLGLTANGVAALAYRARKGLRDAYLRA